MGRSLSEIRSGRRGAGNQEDTTFRIPRTNRSNRQSQLRTADVSVVDELGIYFQRVGLFPSRLDQHTQIPLAFEAYAYEQRQKQHFSETGEKPEITALDMLKRNPKFQESFPANEKEKSRTLFMESRSVEELIVLCNLRLVIEIAKTWETDHLSLPERIDAGFPGLIEGIETYDPTKGKFSDHAAQRIKNHIVYAVADDAYAVPLPVDLMWNVRRVAKLASTLHEQHRRPPTDEELLDAYTQSSRSTNLSMIKQKGMRAISTWRSKILTHDSLNAPTGPDNRTEIDLLEAPTMYTPPIIPNAEKTKQVEHALSQLTPTEAEIIQLSYWNNLSDPDIAEKLDIKIHSVNTIRTRAQKKLEKLLSYMITPPDESVVFSAAK